MKNSKEEVINKNTNLIRWYTDEIYECPICLDNFETKDEIRVTVCKHKFHKECIDSWFDKELNCPMCKYYFS